MVPCRYAARVALRRTLPLEVLRTAWGSAITTTSAGTPGLDLRAGITCQLSTLGVTSIEIDRRCTVADPTLFSHRRSAPTGRLASLVWME